MIVNVIHPVAGAMKIPGVPIKFSDTPAEIVAPAPLLGENTENVLNSFLGISHEEYEKLKNDGVV
ncbi:hypothetical protein MASR1M66_25180 [Aminivibrio sp.]